MKHFLLLILLPISLFCVDLHWEALNEPGSGGRYTAVAVNPHNSNHIIATGDMLGMTVSEDQAETWNTAGWGLTSYECADVTFHPSEPNTVWLGTMGGPWKSTDGGYAWESKRNGMGNFNGWSYSVPIGKILFDPNDETRLLAFSGSHRRWHESDSGPKWGTVWESTDSGETWEQIAEITDADGKGRNIMAATFAATSSDILYAAADDIGVFISEDGGYSWNEMNSNLPQTNANWIEAHPTDPATAWVALGNFKPQGESNYMPGGVYWTKDFGNTWTLGENLNQSRNSDTNNAARYEGVYCAKSNPDVLLTGCTSYSGSQKYISRDGGVTWEKSSANPKNKAYPTTTHIECGTIDPNNEHIMYGAGPSYIFKTTDGGETWIDASSYLPTDETKYWRSRGFSGLVCCDFVWNPNDPYNCAALAMDAGNMWVSFDNTYTWKKGSSVPTYSGGMAACYTGKSSMFAVFGQYYLEGIGRSSDNGNTWKVMKGSKYGLPEKYGPKAIDIYAHPSDSLNVWLICDYKLYHSQDYGESWNIIFEDAGVSAIDGDRNDAKHLYLATADGVYESDDGLTFEKIDGPVPATFVRVDPNDGDVVYACSWRKEGGLWRGIGGSWDEINDDYYIDRVDVHPTDPDFIIVATNDHPFHDVVSSSGVLLSKDGGETWTQQNDGLPVWRGSVIKINPHNPEQIVFGSGGRGFWIANGPEVKVEENETLPQSFHIDPAYPNPFNPSTTLRYELKETAFVKIEIFDTLGRKVKTLIDHVQPSGSQAVQWNGIAENGKQAATGVYLVHYSVGDTIRTQKILLVK